MNELQEESGKTTVTGTYLKADAPNSPWFGAEKASHNMPLCVAPDESQGNTAEGECNARGQSREEFLRRTSDDWGLRSHRLEELLGSAAVHSLQLRDVWRAIVFFMRPLENHEKHRDAEGGSRPPDCSWTYPTLSNGRLLVQKPWTMKDLLYRVRHVLEEC